MSVSLWCASFTEWPIFNLGTLGLYVAMIVQLVVKLLFLQVCVLRVSEQSVEENDGGDMTYASKGLGCEQTSTEEWFCPLHNCVSCGALEQSPFTLRHLHLPSSLLAILPVGAQPPFAAIMC